MNAEDRSTYLSYPISLHQHAFDNIRDVVSDGMDYAVFAKSESLGSGSAIERMASASEMLGIEFPSLENAMKTGRTVALQKAIRPCVVVNVTKTMAFDFYKNKKTEFEIACFCAFTGIKSILGKKPYVKMRNDFLLARMFGFSSIDDMPAQFRTKKIYKKYSTRYHLDKIKKELVEHWNLKLYGRSTRGFYVSYVLAYETLVLHAERKRLAYQTKVKRAENSEILKRVLAKLAAEASLETTTYNDQINNTFTTPL